MADQGPGGVCSCRRRPRHWNHLECARDSKGCGSHRKDRDPLDAGAAERGRLAGKVDVVLDRNRNAEQRRPLAAAQTPVRVFDPSQRGHPSDEPEGVEGLLRLVNPSQRPLDQLRRADLACRQCPCLRAETVDHRGLHGLLTISSIRLKVIPAIE
jgi:hypothetical protein